MGDGRIKEKKKPKIKILEGEEGKKYLLNNKNRNKGKEMSNEQKEEMKKLYEKMVLEPRRRLAESLSNITRIDSSPELKRLSLPEPVEYDVFKKIEKQKSPITTMEENNWKRHNEQISNNENMIKILTKILEEQKSTSKMTKAIIILTIVGIVVALIGAHDQIVNLYNFLSNLKI